MARPRDPQRRVELLDAIIDYLATHGLERLSLRPLAKALGHSTRVLTHHFGDKDGLLTAILERLDTVQHEALRATEGWDDPDCGLGGIVRASWHRHLAPESLSHTRLIHEIEGMAAAGRLGKRIPRFLDDRVEFVARALHVRGLPMRQARVKATFLNSAYAGLQTDYLATGDRPRIDAALNELCDMVDSWTAPAADVSQRHRCSTSRAHDVPSRRGRASPQAHPAHATASLRRSLVDVQTSPASVVRTTSAGIDCTTAST